MVANQRRAHSSHPQELLRLRYVLEQEMSELGAIGSKVRGDIEAAGDASRDVLLDAADPPGRNARDNTVRWHGLGHDRPSSHHGVRPNAHPGKDDDASADKTV